MNNTASCLSEQDILSNAQEYRRIGGIYFLIDEDEVVYVGQSIDVLSRISTHRTEGKKIFDRFAFVESPAQNWCALEREYIRKLNPKYNTSRGVLSFVNAYRKT